MSETLHVIITAENKEAIKAIQDTIKSTEGLQSQFKKVGSASNEANMALINSGRVLQDLNYGFMGIANNLNPLLESYQRLSERTKNNSSVTKELKDALMGPAGIGVALSAAVFIILKFGDAIGDTIEKIVLGRNELREQNNAIEGSSEAYKKAYVEVEKLGSSFDAFHNGTKTKKEVLDEYNKTLGNVYGHTKDINEAESVFISNSADYINAAMLRAAAEYEYKKAAEEASKAAEARAKPTQTFTPFGVGVASSLTFGQNYNAVSLAAKAAQNDVDSTHTKASNFFLGIARDFDKQADLIIASGKKTKNYGEETSNKLNEVQRILKSFNESWRENEFLLSRGKLLAESGPKSYALAQLEEIEKTIKSLSGKNTKEAEDAINSLLAKEKDIYDKFYTKKPKVSPSELDTSNVFRERPEQNFYNRIFGIETDLTKLAPNKFAKAFEMLDKEANTQLIKGQIEKEKELSKILKRQQGDYERFAQSIAGTVTNAFMGLWDAMERGQNIGQSLEEMFKNLAKQLAAMVIQALLFKAIMKALAPEAGAAETGASGFASLADMIMSGFEPQMAAGGIVNQPTRALIGEAGPEAVMPLSKLSSFLNTTFNAGSMSGNSSNGSGQFILRGQDLLLAVNRSQKASNLKGQSISLA